MLFSTNTCGLIAFCNPFKVHGGDFLIPPKAPTDFLGLWGLCLFGGLWCRFLMRRPARVRIIGQVFLFSCCGAHSGKFHNKNIRIGENLQPFFQYHPVMHIKNRGGGCPCACPGRGGCRVRCPGAWSGCFVQWNHLGTIAQGVQVIGPCGHHLDALGHVFGAVVGHTQRPAFAVG